MAAESLSGWRSGGEGRCAAPVACDGEGVHGEGVAEEVEELASVSDAVGSAEPHGVFEGPVDGLGVVSSAEELSEVGVVGRDGPDVLGAVELGGDVLGVLVEPDTMITRSAMGPPVMRRQLGARMMFSQ